MVVYPCMRFLSSQHSQSEPHAPADHGILNGDGESVADVQVAGDVGGREGDGEGALGEGRAVLLVLGVEEALLVPPGVVSSLDLDGVVAAGPEVARDVWSISVRRRAECNSPFFSPSGVGLTHSSAGSSTFFSFSFFSFLGAAGWAEAVDALAACLAAFSASLAAFLAEQSAWPRPSLKGLTALLRGGGALGGGAGAARGGGGSLGLRLSRLRGRHCWCVVEVARVQWQLGAKCECLTARMSRGRL
jgi:hypothetical protein